MPHGSVQGLWIVTCYTINEEPRKRNLKAGHRTKSMEILTPWFDQHTTYADVDPKRCEIIVQSWRAGLVQKRTNTKWCQHQGTSICYRPFVQSDWRYCQVLISLCLLKSSEILNSRKWEENPKRKPCYESGQDTHGTCCAKDLDLPF